MRLAVSNTAWEIHDDTEMFKCLRDNNVKGIEVSPTKVWTAWENASERKAMLYRKMLRNEGIEIPAIQAIPFD